ncbi:MAG: Cof-type HAD-IIB family hydrolase [Lachnospiraceae bacterium]|nr:Cof-type HAD-IIB family hydrolase [Lachnospiraceae bacterium]
MSYEMIVLDLDGTLTNREKIITPRTKAVLKEAMERGKKVVLASGRPVYGVMPLAKELELAKYGGYILAFNGGVILDCATEEMVFSRMLPAEANQKIMQLAVENRVDFLTYENDYILTNNAENQYAQVESKINHLRLHEVDLDELFARLDFPVPKFLMLDDGDYLATVEPKVKAALGKNFSVYRSEPFFLEVLPKGVDKALSLERLLEKVHMTKDQMIACGDGYNDLSMIQFAGLGVAMANGVLPVRKAADYITASNDEDGVALVVEKFMLEDA